MTSDWFPRKIFVLFLLLGSVGSGNESTAQRTCNFEDVPETKLTLQTPGFYFYKKFRLYLRPYDQRTPKSTGMRTDQKNS